MTASSLDTPTALLHAGYFTASGLRVRLAADYGPEGMSRKTAQRLVHRAASFVAAVEEKVHHGPTPE